MKLKNNLNTRTGWELEEYEFHPDQIVTTGSTFMIGNGYLGYRGTFLEWGKDEFVGCIVTDTYDMADGKWRELCNAPNGLYTRLWVDGEEVTPTQGSVSDYLRKISFKDGVYQRKFTWHGSDEQEVQLQEERFASYDNIHLLPMRYSVKTKKEAKIILLTGIDGDVWNLNGEHFSEYQLKKSENLIGTKTVTLEHGITLAVVEGVQFNGVHPGKEEMIKKEKQIYRKWEFTLQPDDELIMEKVVVIYSSNDIKKPYLMGTTKAWEGLDIGYQQLKEKHQARWEKIWHISDIIIEDDLEAQVALRFNLYHNIICTPIHSDRLPIGARGLSCQAYQGAAFWDQEIFNLPMFLYTWPEIARNLLVYRYHTLDGAKRKAQKWGYQGAFYAWVSGKTGDELCPSYFFKDVLSGRKIHNHFNSWQIHISPDIAYTIWQYYSVTQDWEFIKNYGAEMVFEICRFLYSHAYFKKDKNRFELIRLLGPDEYHENVDNNAFSNYQTKYALDKGVKIYHLLQNREPELLTDLLEKLQLTDTDVSNWSEMAKLMYLPEPDKTNGLIEQFDGYFKLEDVSPKELEERLLDPGEYWGWPNGVAVETQVIKQADVIQLFCLQDIFSKEIMKANYDYYEPRTQHGSSLSPSAYSLVAAKIGYIDAAYQNFMKSCTIDMYNTNKAVSGGTFIGGIHTAACGAAWQMIVMGFAGFQATKEGLVFQPMLPTTWKSVAFKLIYQNQQYTITMTQSTFTIASVLKNRRDINVKIGDQVGKIGAGQTKTFTLSSDINDI